MDIESLRLFVAVLDQGNIAGAARVLGLSPSLASRRIAALEAEVGTRLLLRTTRSFAPTEAGATLLAWARSTVGEWARLSEEIGALQGRVSGLVRIATNDFAAASYLPTILAEFSLRHPEVSVSVSIALEPVRLLEGACDIAVHAGRRPDASLVGRRLYEYRRRVVAAPAYLARHSAPAGPADLARHLCLTHTVSEPTEWCFQASGGGRIVTQQVRSHIACDSWTMLKALAMKGAGVARLSETLVRDPIADGKLVELLPDMRSVYADGDPPAMWVLFADRRMPLRTRLFADHVMERLLAFHLAPG
jgi:LysR family transcriptional activator of dmlA